MLCVVSVSPLIFAEIHDSNFCELGALKYVGSEIRFQETMIIVTFPLYLS
jgi:hypothetical protein